MDWQPTFIMEIFATPAIKGTSSFVRSHRNRWSIIARLSFAGLGAAVLQSSDFLEAKPEHENFPPFRNNRQRYSNFSMVQTT
jgi:hypothetical protein